MLIFLTKISSREHRLECLRTDGTKEVAELETKTFLLHDFLHFAFESRAELKNSFWGLVSQGHTLKELSGKDEMRGTEFPKDEIGQTEMIVGALTRFAQGTVEASAMLPVFANMFQTYDKTPPAYLTEKFLIELTEDLRRMRGEWNAVPITGTMQLSWPYRR